MDIGLYREDEQFLFSSPYMESYSSDSTSFETIEQNELFEEIRPMPQPPNEIFEWSEDVGKESSCDMDLLSLTSDCQVEEALCISPSSKDDFHKILGNQNWQPIWQPVLNNKFKKLPINEHTSDEEISISTQTPNDNLQDILDLPEIVNTVNNLHSSAHNKSEANYDNRIAQCSDDNLTDSYSSRRHVSESSDILNSSFNGTDITNFDIAEYIFEENKQSKQSIQPKKISEPIIYKKESVLATPPQIDKKPIDIVQTPTRIVKAAVKKIDLQAQKYIIDKRDIKKYLSEDEDDVDIETVSEEESVPVLEAGNLTDLLEQFEANEVKNQEQKVDETMIVQQPSQNLKVEVKIEKEVVSSNGLKVSIEDEAIKIKKEQTISQVKIKQEQSMCPIKIKREQSICPVTTIKQERPLKKTNEPNHTEIKEHPELTTNITKVSQEKLMINNKKVNAEPIVTTQEATTSTKAPTLSSNRHIIDSLPQELINRIKESGKRKPITVIQAIPNNRKRSRVQELHKPVQTNNPSTVHLDHNYCSVGGGLGSVKKDSGFVSSEEDDRTIISRQPTVKNADGTLMVSLLKANTIRQVEPQRKKLNLEEYKKRRNGLIASNSNSQSCSPSTSTCSSPLPEDDHQKMLKHQEKLKKMAEEVLNAAPKSEKKVDIGKIKAPLLIPLSPSPVAVSPQSISPTGRISLAPIIVEKLVKTEGTRAEPLLKVDIVEQPIAVTQIEAPNLPPNLERKVLVSFGVNTDFKISKDEDPLAPVEKLEEIKPLLEKVSDKINENSLIASVIENIPKIIDKNDKPHNVQDTNEETQYEHGENKQVLYLEVDRERCETKDAETQTNISLIEQTKRGRIRRRLSSSSSCSSYRSKQSSRRSRKSSDSSSSSRSSNSSRRSSLSSRCSGSEFSSRLSSYSRSRSRSPRYSRKQRNGSSEREHLNAVEERRIIYVGKIATSTTKDNLRKKFSKFGPINKISLHFRDIGENYGFVTFKYKGDAHEAYEHGNDDPSHPYYKISFGGRREFCKAAYSDLDNMREDSYYQSQSGGDSYDKLLKEALEKLKKRKL